MILVPVVTDVPVVTEVIDETEIAGLVAVLELAVDVPVTVELRMEDMNEPTALVLLGDDQPSNL